MHPLNEFIPFLHQLAELSGNIIRPYYRTPCDTQAKEDKTPVTEADRGAERAIRQAIEQRFPRHGIIGEEFGNVRAEAEYVWVIDPIDGTKSFIIGRPIFGTLIALSYQGKPLLGLLDQPITNDRWIGGEGVPTECNGKPAVVRACGQRSEAVVATTGPTYFTSAEWKRYEQVVSGCKFPVWGGDCYNYGLLASGRIDVVIESGLKAHDYMALAPIVTAAGGMFTDWQGNPVTLAAGLGKGVQIIAAGDNRVHADALKLLKE